MAVKLVELPAHIAPLPKAVTDMTGYTFTVTVAVPEQPPTVVPVTVYVVVTDGLAFTLAPVVLDNPVAGLHVYVAPPLAVNIDTPPIHIVLGLAVVLIVGDGFTVTVTVEVLTHPFASVPVTV